MTTGPSSKTNGDAWSSGTFAGAEREQLRVWTRLPLRRKLEALEEMCNHARRTIESRRRRGLPYIDPFTDEAVSPTSARTDAVNEEVSSRASADDAAR